MSHTSLPARNGRHSSGLQTDAEREKFIEQFWERRDPTPSTVENEFKEEHYRRIAFANEHFASDVPGWKTDRGRIYIVYGPPDSIDDHRGATDGTLPYQVWTYRLIEGMGQNVALRFTDLTGNGWYVLSAGPGRAEVAWSQDGQELASLDKQIRHAEDTLASLKQEFTESHPAVRRLEAEIEQLKATRAEVASRLEH
jgi:GWxTD domain-containing protein